MTKEEWNGIIEEKLKKGISIDDLKHEYAPGIVMEPNVMASDLMGYDHVVSVKEPWINMALIQDGNATEKNALALQALEFGANGLSIELSPQDDIKAVLKDVLTSYLDVRISCSQLSEKELEVQKASLNNVDFPNVRWVSDNGGFREIQVGESNRIQAIKTCLENIDSNSDIVVTLSKNLLFEIASLRAIRALIDARGIKHYNILCKFEIEGSNDLGDYNLIEKTYKILSGILGGCNSILTPYSGDEDSRLTLNIHNVLDLESGMKTVMDPLGGAYYIEKLTGEIIRQVKEDS